MIAIHFYEPQLTVSGYYDSQARFAITLITRFTLRPRFPKAVAIVILNDLFQVGLNRE